MRSAVRIVALHVYDPRLRWPVPADLAGRLSGRRIDALDRRSKYLLFRLGYGHAARPSGHDRQPARVSGSRPTGERTTTSTSCSTMGRIFATTIPVASVLCSWCRLQRAEHPLLRRLGPEPFDDGVQRRPPLGGHPHAVPSPSSSRLMDNALVVGVGNIYANESLFRAGIRPTLRRAGEVSRPRFARLVEARYARCSPRPSPRAAARCATTSMRPASLAISSSTTLSTGARACRAASAARRSAPPARRARVVLLPALPALAGARSLLALPVAGSGRVPGTQPHSRRAHDGRAPSEPGRPTAGRHGSRLAQLGTGCA